MLTFNDILRIEGVDPEQVRLIRHQDTRTQVVRPLYEIWRTEPERLERYQELQKPGAFREGEHLASFVVTPQPRRETLFIGLYVVNAVHRAGPGTVDPVTGEDVTGNDDYQISRTESLAAYVNRLTIDWGKGRQWRQRASANPKPVLGITDQIEPDFPGFAAFSWDIDQLDDLPLKWKEILRKVQGVYLLVDKQTGARYVGSATGDESLWGRFFEYFKDGHGGNRELRALGRRPYRVSVLQIGSFEREILELEANWKTKLMTREFGLNAN